MKYFKDKNTGEVYAYETEAERQKWGAPELVKMTEEEVYLHKNPPTPEPTEEEIIKAYTAFLERKYDEVAKERRYDNRITCSLRAGYEGPFQKEGIAFGSWMDSCNHLAYQVLDESLTGEREIPSKEELWSMMPVIVWPEL